MQTSETVMPGWRANLIASDRREELKDIAAEIEDLRGQIDKLNQRSEECEQEALMWDKLAETLPPTLAAAHLN